MNSILSKVPVEVAQRIRNKVQQASDLFSQEVKKAEGVSDLPTWASKSCKKCNGTGKLGKILTHKNPEMVGKEYVCSCTRKNYMKWLNNFKLEYESRRTNEKTTD